MDPLQWMGAVRMRVQTADKNITIIHKQSTIVCFGLFLLVNGVWSCAYFSPVKETYFSQKQRLEIKNSLMMDLFITNTKYFSSQVFN